MATPNPTSYTVESDALTLINPTRDGYIFTGWTGTNLSEPTMTVTIPKGFTGNRSYTANWKFLTYLAYNTATGEFETCLVPSTIRTVTSSTTTLGTAGTETWYVVANNVTFNSRIGVLGTVHLILCDGKTLTANYGIGMEKTSTLVIYGQSGGTGKLRASAASMNSIGLPQDQMGGTITIHGGTIESTTKNGSSSAIGGFGHYGGGATVTIYGGHVTARGTGEYGSGIGGSGYHGSGGTVNIQGGTVIVEAGANGHAIGGEINPGSLTLGDMKVYASASATTPVEWSSRVSTCRSTYAKLVPCTEHNMENGICTWCGMFITYDIAYDLAGGTVATPNPTTYSALSDAITLVNPTRDGYVFTGWTGTGLTEPTMTVTIPKGSAGNRAYTATWTAPIGSIDYVYPHNGSISFGGWAYEESNPSTPIPVQVQIWSGETLIKTVEFMANNPREDLGYDCGFTGVIPLDEGTYKVKIMAVGTTSVYLVWPGVGSDLYPQVGTPWTISYDANGGTGAPEPQTNHWAVPSTLSTVQPTRTGYTFTGWNTIADGSGVPYPSGYTDIYYVWEENRTLYAQWTPTEYTITYDLGEGGSVATPNPTSYTIESNAITLVNPTRYCYDFAGWTGTGLTEPTKAVTIPTGSTDDRSYTATWTPITYTVRFHKNDGNEDVYTDQTLTYNVEQPLTANAFTRNGYSFIGWAETADGAVTYADGQSVANLATEQDAVVNLYAKWTETYSIAYDLAGGTVATPNPTTYTALSEDITLVNPTRAGYTFTGWTGTDLAEPTMTVTIPTGSTGNRAYTATWTAIAYTITYDLAGGTVATDNPTGYTVQNEAITLVNPTRERYTFTGWTGTGLPGLTMTVTIPAGSMGNRSYTATWIPEEYYYAYNTTTGTFEEYLASSCIPVSNSTTTMGAANTETWYMVNSNVNSWGRIEVRGTVNLILNDGATLNASRGITVNSGNTLNIYGQTSGTGTLNATGVKVGGDGTESAAIGSIGSAGGTAVGNITIHGGHITANGAGWSAGIGGGIRGGGGLVAIYGGTVNATGHDGDAEGIGKGASGIAVAKTLANGLRVTVNNSSAPVGYGSRVSKLAEKIVKVEPCTAHNFSNNTCIYCGFVIHKVTYDGNNATSGTAPTDATEYKIGQTVTVLGNTGNLMRTGYTFTRWNTAADGNGTDYAPSATFAINHSITLYAKWIPITYPVRFNKNHDEATGTMSDLTFTYDVTQTLTANAFTRDGYDFLGWSTTTDGAVTYTDGQSVSNLAIKQDAVVNLYARWATPYTISYDLAGGVVATSNPTTYYELSEDITLVNPTRAGYTFAGWTGTDLAEPTMTVIIPAGSTGNRAYTATWTPIEYTITYDLAGGTVATDNPTGYTVQSEAITLVNPTRERYTFTGWTGTGLPGLTMTVTIPAGSMGNRSYTATWIPEEYYYAYNTTTGTFEEYLASSCIPVSNSTTTMGAANTETWYMVNSNVNSWGRIEVRGTVNLILNDGATLNASRGITVNSGNTLNIYGQTSGTGTLNATGVKVGGDGTESAAIGSIGSAGGTAVGNITIHGGHITANGAGWSSGIGGGIRGGGGSVKIYGGTVNATGHDGTSEAIGCGSSGAAVSKALAKGLRVTVNNNSSPVGYSSRVSKLAQKVVKVEPCTAHNLSNNTCIYCGITCYGVTYDGNNATSGTVPTDATDYESGTTVTVLDNTGNLERTGYTFSGWNTAANGSGTDYAPGTTFTISSSVTLYAQWSASLLTLANNADNSEAIGLASGDGMYYDVTLAGRTLYKDGDWNTLCLPFDLGNPEAEEGHYFDGTLLEGATVKTLASTEFADGTLTMNFVDVHEIIAGAPYIVKWEGDGSNNLVNPVFRDVTISDATANVETDYVDFVSTYSSVVIYEDGNEKHNLYLGSGNKLYYPTREGYTVNACRAYFQLTNGLTAGDPNDPYSVKAFNLNLGEGVATEIRPTPAPSLNGGEWYDLSGRKLAGKPTKSGVYMNNGRKVAIK